MRAGTGADGRAGHLGALVLVVLLLAGCDAATASPEPQTPDPTAPSSSGAGPTTELPSPTTAAQVREQGSRVEVGDLSLAVPDVTGMSLRGGTDAGPDGSLPYTFTVDPSVAPEGTTAGDGGSVTVALLVTPEGGSFEVQDDRSVLVVDADGTTVAGLAPPVVTGAATGTWRPTLEAVGSDLLALGLQGAAVGAEDGTVEVTWWVSGTALLGADWGDREGGRSLAVEPAPWARAGHDAAVGLTWAQLVAAEPEADSASMHDQLVCHTIGAPDKATWNLEPWRPDVGLLGVLAAACNPT